MRENITRCTMVLFTVCVSVHRYHNISSLRGRWEIVKLHLVFFISVCKSVFIGCRNILSVVGCLHKHGLSFNVDNIAEAELTRNSCHFCLRNYPDL